MSSTMSTVRRLGRAAVARFIAGGFVFLSSLVAPASVGSATGNPPTDAGQVAVVDTASEMITSGGSSTVFGLAVPEGAACPGDSLHDGWIVQSFIVPADVDPGRIVYGAIGPEGPDHYALYQLDTSNFSDALTLANQVPGQPGRLSLPPFSFIEFPPGTLPNGRYRLGVACTTADRRTERYWDLEIEVISAPDDVPGRMTWSVIESVDLDAFEVDGGAFDRGRSLFLPLALAAAGLAFLAVAYRQQRRRRPQEATSDRSDLPDHSDRQLDKEPA
jgi:hypothetical protein